MALAEKLCPYAYPAYAYSLEQTAAPASRDDLTPSITSACSQPVLQHMGSAHTTLITSNHQDLPQLLLRLHSANPLNHRQHAH